MNKKMKLIGVRCGFSLGLMALVLLTAASCGRRDTGETETLAGESELFARRYTYLLRGDDDFPTISSGYRLKINPQEDEISYVGLEPDPKRPVDGEDSCQVIKLILKKEATVLVVVADSIGSGLVSYEFGRLPPGSYTLGTGKHPPELSRWMEDCKRLVVFLAVDKFIRHRARWSVTPHSRWSHLLDF
jgi:hypothetical protein